MVHGKKRIPNRTDRRLTGLAGPEYDASISFGLPFEPEDSQYGIPCLVQIKISLGGANGLAHRVDWIVSDLPSELW